jgi:hypothetical protein
MKNILMVLLILFAVTGCSNSESQADIELVPFDHSYAAYAELLAGYFSDGRFNYTRLKEDRQSIDSIVANIGSADILNATHDEKLAFYINAYNTITIRSIIDEYPVESIKDIKGVWDKKKWGIAGKKLTLDDIEHEILRKDFTEPRIHVAIVCASNGCPPLTDMPFYPDSLDAQLADAAVKFATTPRFNRIDPAGGKAELSKILDWFGDDFIAQFYDESRFQNLSSKENATLHFLIAQFPDEVQQSMLDSDYDISYIEYDWSLNDMK